MSSKSLSCDVAIVGLGPTGAMLANLLGQYGWSVIAIEREEDIYYAPKAVHFDDEVMRIFQFAGLAEGLARVCEPFRDMAFLLKAGGPPALASQVGSVGAPYGWAGAWWFHQPTLERHIRAGLERFPSVSTLLGHTVSAVWQDLAGVTVQAQDVAGAVVSVRARYVIGCDGGRSALRREAGISLESADFDEPWVVVDVKSLTGGKDPALPVNHYQLCDPAQPVTFVPMTGPYYEWQFMVTDGRSQAEATDPAHVRRMLRAFVPPGQVEIIRIAYYKFHALWARTWRKDRIILAGDAAHQMPPFLGQGMCAGVRDAMSLAWRLDLVLAGTADEGVLQHYEEERSAHVRHIIEGAMFLGNVIQTRRRSVAAIRNLLAFALPSLFPPVRQVFTNLANRKRPIECGFIGRNAPKLAGHLAPQPRVRTAEGAMLLDDALGRRCAIIVPADRLAEVRTAVAASGLDLSVFGVDVGQRDGVIGDDADILGGWLRKAGVDFALIRPDRVVYDAGRIGDLRRVLAAFAAALPRPGSQAVAA